MINNKFYVAFLEETVQKHDYNCELIGLALARLFPNPYGKDGAFDLDKYFLVTIWKLLTCEEIFELKMEDGMCVIGSHVPPLYESLRYDPDKYLQRLSRIFSMYKDIIQGYLRGYKINAYVEINHNNFLYLKVKRAGGNESVITSIDERVQDP
ncbi:hypothetical protein VCUG_00856 [Vavraia culicis subsp. floridensis]|uniref:Uncharacterized protein n=1 Tax=Vavraia culicis (isolate floridensis) TaxID=948595 RepID=L2GX26_VAVCU|nr:uncharacterized protein VCUG_00856 [Vavraia culicis subsp. floridensis]ELA47655.1 hypothetical protein VCUG_00856 [Vavraia culicis subsp. floridensis]